MGRPGQDDVQGTEAGDRVLAGADLPAPMTVTTLAAIAAAAAARSGVVRVVQRNAEPEIPDAEPAAGPLPER